MSSDKDTIELEEELGPPPLLLLVGRANGLLVGVTIEDVKGVDRVTALTPLPGSPDSISGLIYFQGGVEAGIDLGVILGGNPLVFSNDTRAVLADAEGRRGAILFDELHEIPEFEIEDIIDIVDDDQHHNGTLKGKFVWKSESGLLIDPAGLLKFVQQDN